MYKTKHFYHIEGSGVTVSAIEQFENLINEGEKKIVAFSHVFQNHPNRMTSIMVVYTDESLKNVTDDEVAVQEPENKKPPAVKTGGSKRARMTKNQVKE